MEALEALFVPVVVRNNVPGAEATVLKRFGEPAWNNPVVRFLDADGKDVIARRDGIYQTGALVSRMVAALTEAKRPVPAWLADLADSASLGEAATATFAMSCFWHGEVVFGSVPGVVATRAGDVSGHEVVEVTFLPQRIAYTELVKYAQKEKCASTVYAVDATQMAAARALVGDAARMLLRPATAAPAADLKYHLQRHAARFVPMTTLQQARLNSALGASRAVEPWLSPSQLADLKRIAALLLKDPAALDGVVPPTDPLRWPAYRAELVKRLATSAR